MGHAWSRLGERPAVYLVHSHGPYPYGWVEYGLTGPHWSAILTGASGRSVHLTDFLGGPQQHATAHLAARAVHKGFVHGYSPD